MFNGALHIDLLFLDDIIALHVMDAVSENPSLTPARSENPKEARDVLSSLRVGFFGLPTRIQVDEGGEWGNEVWTDYCPVCRMEVLSRGRVRTAGSLNVESVLREVFVIVLLRRIGMREVKSPRGSVEP